MNPHPRDRVLWWLGAAIHACLVVFETFLYAVTHEVLNPGKANTLLVMIAASVVMGAVCVDLARKSRKPPFRRPM